ncbi:MAG: DUF488 family protein [Steroidobacteraceae bacterium]
MPDRVLVSNGKASVLPSPRHGPSDRDHRRRVLRNGHSARAARATVRLRLFEASGRFGPGIAYRTESPLHLLNVPASNLGVSSHDPRGFEAWLRSRAESDAMYQPRALYGRYLSECLEGIGIERVRARVDRIDRASAAFRLQTADGAPHDADAVVLASGHGEPVVGVEAARDAETAARILVAWRDAHRIAALPEGASVLCIGSGLTMIDIALTAIGERGAKRFVALSSRGLLPRPHAATTGAGELGARLVETIAAAPRRTSALLRVFCDFTGAHASSLLDWRDAITALRPHLPRLWHELPDDERRRFLRHVRPQWEVHRHRCAPEVADRIERWRAAGRLEIVRGRLAAIAAHRSEFSVRYRPRGATSLHEMRADAVIDATPACTDIARLDRPLIRNLTAAWSDPRRCAATRDRGGCARPIDRCEWPSGRTVVLCRALAAGARLGSNGDRGASRLRRIDGARAAGGARRGVSAAVFTIGHSNHPIERFVSLLQQHGIEVVADVRSKPASRFNPQFNRKALEAALAANGIRYEFLGIELGARTGDPTCYENGRVSYRRLAATEPFRRGLERVRSLAHESRVAIMCAEYEPLDCHRTILVGRELSKADVAIAHILRDGAIESGDEADARLVERLKLRPDDLFASADANRKRELIDRAYEIQGARIAYAPPS